MTQPARPTHNAPPVQARPPCKGRALMGNKHDHKPGTNLQRAPIANNGRQPAGALEGLAHWCAEYYYTLERFGADDAEMPAIRKDMSFCMERCDALGVPYWAQNAALAWAENWRATKSEYFDTAMAKRGITCSGAAG